MPEREELIAFARAIAAELPVDWKTIEASAEDAIQAAIHELKVIAAVAEDVKAQNVMREAGGRIVLMDFGAGWDAHRDEAPGAGGARRHSALRGT